MKAQTHDLPNDYTQPPLMTPRIGRHTMQPRDLEPTASTHQSVARGTATQHSIPLVSATMTNPIHQPQQLQQNLYSTLNSACVRNNDESDPSTSATAPDKTSGGTSNEGVKHTGHGGGGGSRSMRSDDKLNSDRSDGPTPTSTRSAAPTSASDTESPIKCADTTPETSPRPNISLEPTPTSHIEAPTYSIQPSETAKPTSAGTDALVGPMLTL
ncbi:hypothetical protein T265_03358 [Opisthorchis viverrini]|uniref:Uncharacterized protein n=1 Tax=Opisthorchis viverrini TaxID=6198 RepID=A0A074ZSY8_OPIVI|nr:hypothetical protein T265_03358 [Opisthorchis viverrini]KER30206.1 hypothetical protein T265_03358 [Opisthorchis viverrini]